MMYEQKGQAAVEFAISIGALLALVLAIPIVAKIANAHIMSIQALDYAAWRVREGNTDNIELSREVNDRYFGETALIVDDEQIDHQGANLGRGKDNRQIYVNNTVSVNYNSNRNEDSWRVLEDMYGLGVYDKQGTVSLNLPLENLDVIPEIASSMTIEKSIYIDNASLTARDSREIDENVDDISSIILPYNNGVQQSQNIVFNTAIDLISSLGFIHDVFDDHRIDDVKINHDAVPQDRLTEFNP